MTEAAPASFWARVAAFLLDLMVTIVPAVAAAFALIALGAGVAAVFFFGPLWTGIFLVYASVTEGGGRQATVGKRALGLVVTDVGGRRIYPGRAFARASVKLAPFVVVGLLQQVSPLLYFVVLPLPYLAMALAAVTRRKQALHDLVAGTLVVRAQPAE